MRQSLGVKCVLTLFALGLLSLPVHAEMVLVDRVYYDSINDGTDDNGNAIDRSLFGRPSNSSVVPDPNNEFGRSFTGNAFNSFGSGPITRVDFLLSATTTPLTSYDSIQVNLQFWERFGDDLGTSWFADPVGFRSNVFDTSGSLPANFSFVTSGADFSVFRVSLILDTPITFANPDLNGITFNIKGNTGSGFFNTDNLSTLRTRGNGFLAGSSPLGDRGGHLRNNSGRTDYNFSNDPNVPGADLILAGTDGANEALGVRLYDQVFVDIPEVGTAPLFVAGGAVFAVGLIRRRKK